VRFLYIEIFKFLSLQCIVRSKKIMDSCSFSIVTFIDGCSLLKSLSVCSMFVVFWYVVVWFYHRHIYKVSDYLLFYWGWIYFFYVPCVVYMFQPSFMMLGHPWLSRRLIYSTAGQIESNFVPLLFVVCVIFLFGCTC
jgi:hypothetical protein